MVTQKMESKKVIFWTEKKVTCGYTMFHAFAYFGFIK